MATLQEMNDNMTIVYSKTTGEIKGLYTGIQEITTLYGAEGEDYAIIWDRLVVEKDDYVLNNIKQFKIDTVLKKLLLKDASTISKYI